MTETQSSVSDAKATTNETGNGGAYPHVFRPLTVGPMHLRHRIMVTGHTQLYGQNGTLSERHLAYYEERARGGAALLILEQQAAH